MKLTYLINQYPKVSHSFIRREIHALERQGHSVQRIAIRGWADDVADQADVQEKVLTNFVLKQGIIFLLFDFSYCLLSKPLKMLNAFKYLMRMQKVSDRGFVLHLVSLMEACRIQGWLKHFRSEFIHAHFGTNSAEVAMYASLISGIPYSFTVHGPEEFDKPLALNLVMKSQFAKFIVCVSSYGKSQLYRWISSNDWHKVHVVHCGIDQSFFQDSEPVDKIEIPCFVCVGRLCEQKGQLLLIEAARILKGEGASFRLVLAGDGEMRGLIEKKIIDNQLQEIVDITGWIDSNAVKSLLKSSVAMVLPSFAEGLPVVIMEAMAVRCPVISTYIAGIPELIKSDENGWLVPAGDVDSLVSVMRRVISLDRKKIIEVTDRALFNVKDQHDIDVEVAKLSKLFLGSNT